MNTARPATARGGLRQVTWEATVIGPCRHCGAGAEFWPDSPCVAAGGHEAAYVRPLGVVSRWHKRRLVRVWWAAQDRIRRRNR